MNSALEKNCISCFPFSVEFWKSYYKYIIMHSIVNKDVYENFSLKKWDKYLDFSTSLKKKMFSELKICLTKVYRKFSSMKHFMFKKIYILRYLSVLYSNYLGNNWLSNFNRIIGNYFSKNAKKLLKVFFLNKSISRCRWRDPKD